MTNSAIHPWTASSLVEVLATTSGRQEYIDHVGAGPLAHVLHPLLHAEEERPDPRQLELLGRAQAMNLLLDSIVASSTEAAEFDPEDHADLILADVLGVWRGTRLRRLKDYRHDQIELVHAYRLLLIADPDGTPELVAVIDVSPFRR